MNDGEREYAKMLKQMEAEVLALKTAHQRPLGTLNFFVQTNSFNVTIPSGSYGIEFNLIVQVATPAIKPPIVQTGWEIPNGFFDITLEETSMSSNYDSWVYKLFIGNSGAEQTVPINVGVVSSQPIVSISWSNV